MDVEMVSTDLTQKNEIISEITEINESYEDLVKQLKPLSVVLYKISEQRLATLKLVDEPNLIKDEAVPHICDEKEDEEKEEEIEIDLSEAEAEATSVIKDVSRQYSCFCCKKKVDGYEEALTHYQLHIDYYPIQCSICDEANPNIHSFVTHCRKFHPELEKAKYIFKNNPIYYNWIHNFLTTEAGLLNNQIHKYCPVCDWMSLPGQPDSIPPKVMAILRHIHEHIQYMPFECIKCRENGVSFRVHYLDSVMRAHVTSEHKELEPPFWRHFNKRFSIPSLDKFIANYLQILGFKMPKRRNTKKRTKPQTPSIELNGQTSQTMVSNNSLVTNSLNTNKQTAIQLKPQSIAMNSNPILLQNLLSPMNQMVINQVITYPDRNNSQLVIIGPQTHSNYQHMENPILVLPSNDKLNFKPQYVESTDLGVVCLDPQIVEIDEKLFKYLCVFCDEEKSFQSKIEMCVHYSIHLSYYPIVCMICEKTFLDLSTLLYHYIKSHEEYKNNLFHYFKENEKIEKWINYFVDFQKTHEFKGNVSAVLGDHCFVCQKLSKNETSFRMNCNKNQTKVIRDHIHQHLHYFPYKCLICFHGNREVRFTSFNASAVVHFNTFHGLNSTAISSKNLSKLMAKTDEILDLEKFIDSKLFPKRETDSETPITLNLKRKLEEIEMDVKKRLTDIPRLPASSSSALPSAQVLPMVRHENNRSPTEKPQSLLRISTTASPQKFLNGMNFRQMATAPVSRPRPIEYMPNKITYIEPYLLCFHCHQKVSNTKELESHHMSKHPKLTIASYAPTKKDLMLNS